MVPSYLPACNFTMEFESVLTTILTKENDCEISRSLESLLNYLHQDRSITTTKILTHPGSEDLLSRLTKLLSSTDNRTSGNAAYILGVLAETEQGFARIYSIGNKTSSLESVNSCTTTLMLDSLVSLLASSDTENVINASGTLGILAEFHKGREWMLESRCISAMIDAVTSLLTSENLSTSSNCALILARITIRDRGCKYLLEHNQSSLILRNLIDSLKIDSTGRGTNAAFALGRLYDQRKKHLVLTKLDHVENMITALSKILNCNDHSACKNACFALSCIFIKEWNQDIFLSSRCCTEILETLAKLLFSQDHETGWFAAVTIHTIARVPRGCLQIRRHTTVEASMKDSLLNEDNQDLIAEITSTLEIIKRLEKPSPPRIRHIDSTWIEIEWNQVISKCGFIITYKIFVDQSCVNQSTDCCHCLIDSLKPSTEHRVQLQVTADEDESPMSESVSVITAEEILEAPKNLRLVAQTQNQVELTWDPPSNYNSAVKYIVHTECESQNYSKKQTVMENISTINGLLPATQYNLQVAATNRRGQSPFSSIQVNTPDKCSYIPPKLNVTIIGRYLMHLSWLPPKNALGRVNRYEVFMDGSMVYSGNNMTLALTRLTPNTEYTFMVSAITSEGRLDSVPVKKKTAKVDFDIETTVSKSVTNAGKKKNFSQKPSKSSMAQRCKSAYCLKRNHSKIRVSSTASLLNKITAFEKHQRHSASQFIHYMHNQNHNTNSTKNIKCSTGKSLTLLSPNQININLYGTEVNILDTEDLIEIGENLDLNKTPSYTKIVTNSSLENIEQYRSIPNKENIVDTPETHQFSKTLLTSVWTVPQNIQNRRLKKTSAKASTKQSYLSNANHIVREVENSCSTDTNSCLELRIPHDELAFHEKSSGSKENCKQKYSNSTTNSKVDRRTLTIAKSLHNLKLNEEKRTTEEQMRLSPSVGTTKKFCSKEIKKEKQIANVNANNLSSSINNEDEHLFLEKLLKSECNGNQEKRQKSPKAARKNKCIRSSGSGKHLSKFASYQTSLSGKSKVTRMHGKSTNLSSPQSNGPVKENKTYPGKIISSYKVGHWKSAVKSDASNGDLMSNALIEKVVYSTRKPSSTGRAKSSCPRLSTITVASDITEYRIKSAGCGENFLPSQIRAQPSNLNLRQLERIHATLLGMKDNKGNSNLRRLIYKKIQDMLLSSLSVDPSLSFNSTSLTTNKQLGKSKCISTLFGKKIPLNAMKVNGTKPSLKS